MSSFFKNNRNLLLGGAALALTGAAMLAYRYRDRRTPVTGHWIGEQPVMPSQIPSELPESTRTAMSNYLLNTHMNMQHGDMQTLQKRALAHHQWASAENSILETTRQALTDTASAPFRMSSQLAHYERRLLADSADDKRKTKPEGSHAELDQEVRRLTHEYAQGSGAAYDSLTDMLIHGKRGPFTKEQSALGIEATIVGHHVLKKTPKYGEGNPRMQARRPDDPISKKPSHPTTSRYGMDLSIDPGSQLRESLGLPIMTGTSGSASDVIRSSRFTMDEMDRKDKLSEMVPKREFMSLTEHRTVMHDLTFNWMRRGVPAENVRKQITQNQTNNGFRKISTPPPTATQTHTYPEIVAGVDLTLDGNSPDHLRESTHRALDAMTRHR